MGLLGRLRRRVSASLHPATGLDWHAVELCAMDFEATTANPRQARPLSVGWVVIRSGRVQLATAGYTMIGGGAEVPLDSMRVHHLVPEDLAHAPHPAEVAALLSHALAERVLVAHAAQIELALLARLGVDHPRRRTIDTLQLTRRLEERRGLRGARPFTLSAVAHRYGLPVNRPHHAAGDAFTTAGLLLALAAEINGGTARLDDLLHLGRP